MSVFRHVFLRWCDVCYIFPRCCGVNSPPMSSSLSYLKPLRNSKTFLHGIYKSKKKTNLLWILNNVFQYSKIRTRKQMVRKALKQKKKLESSPFWNPESTELESGIQYSESGIHRVESRIHDCHGFPYMGRFFNFKTMYLTVSELEEIGDLKVYILGSRLRFWRPRGFALFPLLENFASCFTS